MLLVDIGHILSIRFEEDCLAKLKAAQGILLSAPKKDIRGEDARAYKRAIAILKQAIQQWHHLPKVIATVTHIAGVKLLKSPHCEDGLEIFEELFTQKRGFSTARGLARWQMTHLYHAANGVTLFKALFVHGQGYKTAFKTATANLNSGDEMILIHSFVLLRALRPYVVTTDAQKIDALCAQGKSRIQDLFNSLFDEQDTRQNQSL